MIIFEKQIKPIPVWFIILIITITFFISSVTEFEVITGATIEHLEFWDQMLERFTILSFDSKVARCAAKIVRSLKTKRRNIDKPDLFIAATAIVYGLTLDTANKKHFTHIDNLDLLV